MTNMSNMRPFLHPTRPTRGFSTDFIPSDMTHAQNHGQMPKHCTVGMDAKSLVNFKRFELSTSMSAQHMVT